MNKLSLYLIRKYRKSRYASTFLRIGQFNDTNIVYRRGSSDEQVVFEESFQYDPYLRGVPEYKPDNHDIIIDVGAYIGTFSILCAKKVPQGKVYAIEACQDSFTLLKTNIELNRLNNVETFHLALGDKIGTTTLYHYRNGEWGHSTVINYGSNREDVQSLTLEAFLNQNKISKCHFLKLNCEGAEYPIILNSSSDALRRINIMLVLYHNDMWLKNTEVDLVKHLELCGFSTEIRDKYQYRGWIVAVNKNAAS